MLKSIENFGAKDGFSAPTVNLEQLIVNQDWDPKGRKRSMGRLTFSSRQQRKEPSFNRRDLAGRHSCYDLRAVRIGAAKAHLLRC
jgi:hypothetical protein